MNALGWVGQASWAKAYFVKYQTWPFQKLPYFPNLLSLFIRNTHNDWQGRAENGATCKIAPFQPVASIGGLLSVRQRGGLGAGVVSDQLCFISIVREAGAVLCASDCSHSSAWHWGHTFWKRHPTQGLRAFKGGCISLWRGFSSFQIY